MRKTTLVLLLAAATTTIGCKKAFNPTGTQSIITDTSFSITTASSISTTGIGSKDVAVSLTHSGEKPKSISLSVTGLPTSATALFAPASGSTPFSSVLSIKTKLTKSGTYPIKIQAFSSGTAIGQEQNVSLIVQPTPRKECDDFFFIAMGGKPIVTKYGQNNSTSYTKTTVLQKSSGELYFNDVMIDYSSYSVLQRTSSSPLVFTVNCETGQITIDEQLVQYTSSAYGSGNVDISGTGVIDFSTNTYKVTYTSRYGAQTLEGTIFL